MRVRLNDSGKVVDLPDAEAKRLVREGRASLVEHPDARTGERVHRDPQPNGKE
jgi:hypothetical protein